MLNYKLDPVYAKYAPVYELGVRQSTPEIQFNEGTKLKLRRTTTGRTSIGSRKDMGAFVTMIPEENE